MIKGVWHIMSRKQNRVLPIAVALILALVLGGIALAGTLASKIKSETGDVEIPNPIVTMKLSSGGTVEIELYPAKAPNTVANFVELIQSGFYDGLNFHRVSTGFVIQGGDPLGNGTGGPGHGIKGEFASNGFDKNDLKHTRGVISMARSSHPDSAGSQFFIMHADSSFLDGEYAAFGQVISGMEYVDIIANTPPDAHERPLSMADCVIESMTVDTKGMQYETVKIVD